MNIDLEKKQSGSKMPVLRCLVYHQKVFSHIPTILSQSRRFSTITDNFRILSKISEDYHRRSKVNDIVHLTLD